MCYRKNKIRILWGFFPLFAIIIASLWTLEENHKLNTVIVALLVYFLSWALLWRAKTCGVIESQTEWMIAFLLAMALTVLVTKYCWVLSFEPDGHRKEYSFDPATYDLYGKRLAEADLDASSLSFSRVQDLGMVYYIGAIYRVFGTSTCYVGMFNMLFCLVAFLSLTGILVHATGQTRPWQLMRFGMFLPELLYYTAIPGKEALSTGLFCGSLYFLYRSIKGGMANSCVYAVLLVVLLAFVRSALAAGLFFVSLPFLLSSRKRAFNRLCVVVIVFMVTGLFASVAFEGVHDVIVSRVLTGLSIEQKTTMAQYFLHKSSIISNKLIPSNIGEAALYAPLRAGLLLIAPFPNISLSLSAMVHQDYSVWVQRFYSANSVVNLLLMPAIMAAILQKSCRQCPAYRSIVVPFLFTLLLAANAVFFIHGRYRTVADPFILATSLIGWQYGRPGRFIPIWGGIVLLGFIAKQYMFPAA